MSCEQFNSQGEELHWKWSQTLGECIYSRNDEAAFLLGCISIGAWTLALMPQIIVNWLNKGAESQSFYFWLLWLFSDGCNLIGCIMTRNLITNTILAGVDLFFTGCAFAQFYYYEYIFTDDQIISKSLKQASSSSASLVILKPEMQALLKTPDSPEQIGELKSKSSGPPSLRRQMSHALTHSISTMRLAPRVFNVDMMLKRNERQELRDLAMANGGIIKTRDGRVVSKGLRRAATRRVIDVDLTAKSRLLVRTMSRKVIGRLGIGLKDEDDDGGDENGGNGSLPCASDGQILVNRFKTREQTVVLDGISEASTVSCNTDSDFDNPVPYAGSEASTQSRHSYGSTNKVALATAAVLGTISFVSLISMDLNGMDSTQESRRRLGGSDEGVWGILDSLGIALGWLASVVMVVSHVPQIMLMMDTKIVSGISPLFFCMCLLGNLAQCASMLVKRDLWHQLEIGVDLLPWLIASGLCMAQDAWILFLLWLYRDNRPGQESLK